MGVDLSHSGKSSRSAYLAQRRSDAEQEGQKQGKNPTPLPGSFSGSSFLIFIFSLRLCVSARVSLFVCVSAPVARTELNIIGVGLLASVADSHGRQYNSPAARILTEVLPKKE
jgi:hypothetical protein